MVIGLSASCSRRYLAAKKLFDQRVLRLQDFGGAGVFAGDVFAGPLVGFGERVFFDWDVMCFGNGACGGGGLSMAIGRSRVEG